MKYYIIAGEASGDLHASNLIKCIKKIDPNSEFKFWGGDLMSEIVGKPVKHIKELAFMGFIPVLLNLKTILKNIKFCKSDILNYKPDALILVDYPGFNLKIAEFAAKNDLRVFYYISPTVWAWHQSRVEKIKRYVLTLYPILPFESEFYAKFKVKTKFFGHPLVEHIEREKLLIPNFQDFKQANNLTEKKIIALLPGSRMQEIKAMLPVMVKITKNFPEYEFIIAGAPSISDEIYKKYIKNTDIKIIYNKTYNILQYSHAALVTSGTATLETALFKVPQIVCYKMGKLTYHIAKQLLKIKYISLVNLILDKPAIPELIQNNFDKQTITEKLKTIIIDGETRNNQIDNYNILIKMLSETKVSESIANDIYSQIKIYNKCKELFKS